MKAALDKKVPVPDNKSFEVVKAGVLHTPLLACRLAFFASVAKEVEPTPVSWGKKRVMAEDCDRLLNEYMRFVGEVGKTDPFTNFDRNVDRLDTFYFSIFSGRQSGDRSLLWKVIKDVLLLSHGQASVERGFSVNKQIATDNMQQKTLTALRILQDHISSVGGAQNIVITPKLLASASQAKSRYNAYLEETRRQAEKAALSGKRKEMFDQLEEVEAKKARLEEEATDLLKTADQCGDKGESTGQINFFIRSQALRRSAKDKRTQICILEQEIKQKNEELQQAV